MFHFHLQLEALTHSLTHCVLYPGGLAHSLNEAAPLSAPLCRVTCPEDGSGVCGSLVELLERESQSQVFVEGISYALFKVAERGLLYAAQILLGYGAHLNFEGE